MHTFPTHPLADAFPLIEGPAFDELVASIKEYGLREPITLLDGAVLDGRNRLRACEAGDVEPRFETFTGSNAAAFVIDKNINRRHLNTSQRSMIAAKLAQYRPGSNQHQTKVVVGLPTTSDDVAPNIGNPILTLPEAAALLNVNRDSVSNARKVLAEGTPEEIERVEKGEASVTTIADQIRRGVQPDKRLEHKPQAKRNGTQQMHAEVWQTFKTALISLTDLPRVEDTVVIIRGKERNGFIAEKLPIATEYLREFLNAWNNSNAH